MTAAQTFEWHSANQRYLIARLAMIRTALTRHAARANGAADGEAPADETASNADAMLDEATRALLAPAALDTLCAAFSLSPFERDVLLMCAGLELDSTFASTFAAAHGNPQRPFPTFSLALAALPDAHWTALSPAGPLRRWRLIEVGAADSLTTGHLRIDERVLHYLTGVTYVDARLYGLVEPLPPPPMLPPSQREVAERIAALWSQSKNDAAGWPIILLGGDDRAAARAVAGHVADALAMQVHVLRGRTRRAGPPLGAGGRAQSQRAPARRRRRR
jgi:hypothetical protein